MNAVQLTMFETQPATNQPQEHDMSALPEPATLTHPLHVSVETIVPADAARYLENIRNPRRLRPRKVSIYASDMAAGHWAVGSSSLKFDAAGALRDGQHRLAACIEAGVPFTTVVHWNVSDEAIANTDRGMNRQWADELRGKGMANAHGVQGAVYLSWRWDTGQLLSTSITSHAVPTASEAEAWLEANPSIVDQVSMAQRVVKPLGAKLTVAAAFFHRASQIDLDAADRMLESLRTGAHLDVDDPIRRLRERLQQDRMYRAVTGRDHQTVELGLFCKSWNAWQTGKQMRQLSFRVVERFPNLVDAEGNVHPFPDVMRQADR